MEVCRMHREKRFGRGCMRPGFSCRRVERILSTEPVAHDDAMVKRQAVQQTGPRPGNRLAPSPVATEEGASSLKSWRKYMNERERNDEAVKSVRHSVDAGNQDSSFRQSALMNGNRAGDRVHQDQIVNRFEQIGIRAGRDRACVRIRGVLAGDDDHRQVGIHIGQSGH